MLFQDAMPIIAASNGSCPEWLDTSITSFFRDVLDTMVWTASIFIHKLHEGLK
jgi:hypothetical protein